MNNNPLSVVKALTDREACISEAYRIEYRLGFLAEILCHYNEKKRIKPIEVKTLVELLTDTSILAHDLREKIRQLNEK